MDSRLECSASEAQPINDRFLINSWPINSMHFFTAFFWLWFMLCEISEPFNVVYFPSWKGSSWHQDKSNLFSPSPLTSFLLSAIVCSKRCHASTHVFYRCKITIGYLWFQCTKAIHKCLIIGKFNWSTMCVITMDFKHTVKICWEDKVLRKYYTFYFFSNVAACLIRKIHSDTMKTALDIRENKQ